MRISMRGKLNKGFTLMELLIVVAIVVVLVAISIPIFTKHLNKSREATCKANCRSCKAEFLMKYQAGDLSETTDATFATVYDAEKYPCPFGGTYSWVGDANGAGTVVCSHTDESGGGDVNPYEISDYSSPQIVGDAIRKALVKAVEDGSTLSLGWPDDVTGLYGRNIFALTTDAMNSEGRGSIKSYLSSLGIDLDQCSQSVLGNTYMMFDENKKCIGFYHTNHNVSPKRYELYGGNGQVKYVNFNSFDKAEVAQWLRDNKAQ